MWWIACFSLLVLACGKPEVTAKPVTAPTMPIDGARPYSGPPETGPCESAHDCVLRDNCGCSCDAVVLSAPKRVACEETCSPKSACEGHTIICDLATHRCSALPKPPP